MNVEESIESIIIIKDWIEDLVCSSSGCSSNEKFLLYNVDKYWYWGLCGIK